jgi:DDB1- and CUL4-associated factor 11
MSSNSDDDDDYENEDVNSIGNIFLQLIRRMYQLGGDEDIIVSDDAEDDEDYRQPSRSTNSQLLEHNFLQQFGRGSLVHDDEEQQSERRSAFRYTDLAQQLRGPSDSVASLLRKREMFGRFSRYEKGQVGARYLPLADGAEILAQFSRPVFGGQFSSSGRKFLSSCQDGRLRVYHTRHEKEFELAQTVDGRDTHWAIVSTDMSADERFVIYTSWSNFIHLVELSDDEFDDDDVEPTTESDDDDSDDDFDNDSDEWRRRQVREQARMERRRRPSARVKHKALDLEPPGSYHFCVFSAKVSPNSNEILAGTTGGGIMIYDLEKQRRTLALRGHSADVNSICFATDESAHLFYSGSDDCTAKVWDRRLLGKTDRPVGVLVGHMGGLTHVASRGDGRHLATNSKDQSLKLWDVRAMQDADADIYVPRSRFDYRYGASLSDPTQRMACSDRFRHRADTSLMTYRGHGVLNTLVRCYFSPAETTGNRYIVSGCHSGSAVVYDVLGGDELTRVGHHEATVRDVAWHSEYSQIITSSWDSSIHRSSSIKLNVT